MNPAEERKLEAWSTLTPCIPADWKCSEIRRPHVSEAATNSTTHTEEMHLRWVHKRLGINVVPSLEVKEEARETNGLLVLKLTSCRYMVEAFEGQVLGNWIQKEEQLSITCQCMQFSFRKAELSVICLNINT